jgi:hypothetical protein
LAGQGKFEEARDMVGVGEKELGIVVDVHLWVAYPFPWFFSFLLHDLKT